ncbi:MAG TPA: FAD:protein FMN transferase [Gemmataceae bacterium]|nr:FAD:protein FMN transferase [Gemmataceae bacterium]
MRKTILWSVPALLLGVLVFARGETPPPNPLPETERGRREEALVLLPLSVSGRGLGGGVFAQTPKRYQFSEPHMGTLFRITLYAADEETAKRAAKAAFARAAELDRIMSDYKQTSELMQLCKKAGGPPVRVSEDLFTVLSRAQEVAKLTDGALDVTVGPIVRMWRRARRTREMPDPAELKKALALVGYDKIRLNAKDRTVQLLVMGMLLDLGAIAKGYAAQMLLELLRRQGISRALVAAGGDIAAGDPPPGEKGWKVGIAPLEDPNAKPVRYLLLKNAAVSTAGDAEQYVVIDGKRYSHIVDPKTGLGLTTRTSVTVVARDGTTADAWDTALCVVGPERGLKLIEQIDGAAALFVIGTEKGQVTHASKRWAQYEVTSP